MKLNEREAHCVARLLQGALFGKSTDDGCEYCKFRCERVENRTRAIRSRLSEETGVDLDLVDAGGVPMSDFPHGRFLKNANKDMKKRYQASFKWLSELGDI